MSNSWAGTGGPRMMRFSTLFMGEELRTKVALMVLLMA